MRDHLVAIQGSISSFHDVAARKYFGETANVLECGSFREVCSKIEQNQADYGIIAIENKVAGSILLNYQLIETFGLKILGETFLPIQLQLLVKPGTQLSEIKEIISHPMALGQCQLFLSGLEGVQVTEFKDTATSAKLIQDSPGNHIAVIGGPKVAETYGLEALLENVSDETWNYTRFYILSKNGDVAEQPNKASVTIRLANESGQLLKVLNVLAKYNHNMTKIQSIPIPNDHTTYSFHLDIEFEEKATIDAALIEIQDVVISSTVLGVYKSEPLPITENVTKQALTA